MNPRVSVLIPAYNAEQCVETAIKSAQAQTICDIEILVIDDASSDSTATVVLTMAALDSRIRLIRRAQNGGPAAARNDGLREARGEWIALLDADDSMTAERFELLLAAATEEDVMVADNLRMYDRAAREIVGTAISEHVLGDGLRLDAPGFVERCRTNQADAIDFGLLKPIMRRSAIQAMGLMYDENLRYGEDFRFYVDLLIAGGRLLVLPRAMYQYTERIGSVSKQSSGLSKTLVQYESIEQHTRAMARDARYELVAHQLERRADAIRRLAALVRFRQRSVTGKLVHASMLLRDGYMRRHFAERAGAKIRSAVGPRGLSSKLAQDAANLCVGQGIKLVLQAVYFVLIGRCLGPAQYGAFAAVAAVNAILSPFVGLGCGPLFLRNVRAGKRDAQVCWGNGLLATAATGAAASLILWLSSTLWISGLPQILLIVLCTSDLIFTRVIDVASFGFAATGQMRKTAIQNTIMSALRVAGIALLAALSRPVTIEKWCWVYLATSIVGALVAIQQGGAAWGRPRMSLGALWDDVREGCFFSISTSAQTIYNDIDKAMLARLSSFEATGLYAAAYRVIDTSLVPVRALVSAAYPEFFRIGKAGLPSTFAHAKRMIAKALTYGALDCVALILFAPLLAFVLGPRYAGATAAIRILSIIPAARCVHWFLADALSGADLQGLRTAIQIGIAALNVALNVVVLPRWSWRGAAWTSVGCDVLLALSVWAAIRSRIPDRIAPNALFTQNCPEEAR